MKDQSLLNLFASQNIQNLLPERSRQILASGEGDDDPPPPPTEPPPEEERKKGPPRPLPDPPRLPSDWAENSATKVYALFIGINEYRGDIPDLSGCAQDVNFLETYLGKYRGNPENEEETILVTSTDPEVPSITIVKSGRLRLCTALNQQATYENLLQAFDAFADFLSADGATGKDSFWFHFSGHGTEQYTAEEFYRPRDAEGNQLDSLAPNGKDQCLVCHNPDGGLNGVLLADKEIAVFLQKVHNKVPLTSENQRLHVVVTLDCCHSGTGTRDLPFVEGFRNRNHKIFESRNWEDSAVESGARRPIGSYYNGYYADNLANGLKIPQSPHILIAASDNQEVAGEDPEGGLFTHSLQEVLSQTNAVNYIDLFTRVRTQVNKRREDQSPQYEPIDSFNPYTRFLEGWDLPGNIGLYEVWEKSTDNWQVRLGAVNGLPTDSPDKTQIIVLDADTHEVIGNPLVSEVGVQNSRIEMKYIRRRESTDDEGNTILTEEEVDLVLNPSRAYIAKLYKLPAEPFYVYAAPDLKADLETTVNEATGTDGEDLRRAWEKLENFNILWITDDKGAEEPGMIVSANEISANSRYEHSDPLNELEPFLVNQPSGSKTRRIERLLRNIQKTANWKRLLNLNNSVSELPEYLQPELVIVDKNNTETVYPTGNVVVESAPDTFIVQEGSKDAGLNYKLRFRFNENRPLGEDDKLYFYLFYLSNDSALIEFAPRGPRKVEHASITDGVFTYQPGRDEEQFFLSFLEETQQLEEEYTNRLKLLVSTEEIAFQQLEQEGFSSDRGGVRSSSDTHKMNDWQFFNFIVTMTSASTGEVFDENTEIVVNDALTIHNNGALSGRRLLGSTQTNTRSAALSNPLDQIVTACRGSLVDLDPSGTPGRYNLLELSDLENAELVDQASPLQIDLSASIAENEILLPVVVEGGRLRIIGEATGDENGAQVAIHELPSDALRIAFFKFIPNQPPTQPQLSWLRFTESGVEKRTRDLNREVEGAAKILLLIHGLIGDTRPMANALANLPGRNGLYRDQFDLVLCYDYPNFNHSLESAGTQLKGALEQAGLHSGKSLTIIADSFGGLVARQFVEREKGYELADHLILLGAPNRGAAFSQTGKTRRFAWQTLNLAVNYATGFFSHAAALQLALQASGDALNTLQEASPASNFLSELNRALRNLLQRSGSQKVRYTIFGGDAGAYLGQASEEGLVEFLNELGIAAAGNDLAVDLESILGSEQFQASFPQIEYHRVACYYLNYLNADNIGRL